MSKISAGPMLSGIKIIDLTSVVFGPYATQILADLGAEVIKIEPRIGDNFRYSARWAKTKGMSPGYMALNRGKKSVVLDLKDDADKDTMRRLLAGADIFIHNVRAKAIERLGFSPDAVKKINPDLIYIHCVGFGSGGPYSDLQAYDDIVQAMTGTATLLSRVDGNPRPRYIPSLIADKVAGLHATYATLAAVVHKLRTGEPQFVEVPMYEAFTGFMLKEHLGGKTFDPPAGEAGYPRQIDPDRQPFPTKDGYVSIVPYTPESWDVLFKALGDEAFIAQTKYRSAKDRARYLDELYQAISDYTPHKTSAEWVRILNAVNIPCMPVTDLSDIVDDPHLHAVGFINKREHPTEGFYYEMREPSKFSAWTPPEPLFPPTIGQHSDELSQTGQSEGETSEAELKSAE